MRSIIRDFFNRSPVSYVPRNVFQSNEGGAPGEQLMRSYGSVGVLFAMVNRLASGTASANWHLYRGDPSTKHPDPSTEVLNHPAKDLWDHPNPFYSQSDFVETFQQHLDLVGEGWWILSRSNAGFGPPLELWPVRPDKMAPVPHPTDFISGYTYKNGSETVPLGIEDVIFLKYPNPLDAYRGLGPVQAILTDIDAERFSSQWNRNFFFNSAEPGGVIEFERSMSRAEFEEFLFRWREQHQGVANAHRVAILEKGKWVDRKYTQRDMSFVQLREMNRDLMMLAFGFPRPLLGITTDVNRANAEAAEVVFARWLLRPRLERIKQALNEKLLPLFGSSGKGLYFDYEDPTPEDRTQETTEMTAKVTALVALAGAGFDTSEACDMLGLPELTRATRAPQASFGRFQGKADPVEVAANRIEENWADRLDTERISLEKFIDEKQG
jgi:HK97 family phage portal protein